MKENSQQRDKSLKLPHFPWLYQVPVFTKILGYMLIRLQKLCIKKWTGLAFESGCIYLLTFYKDTKPKAWRLPSRQHRVRLTPGLLTR